ncbi:cupin domain-containing protein [Bacillus massiliigorillae]|uniref:cupin domain-containing protein n=1 Tax=Bacillus massiliigorillae TaxID=1243664 RepID=UPI0003A58D69|nr:cupin domain-containing protein [Bacillus massiliigorillae]
MVSNVDYTSPSAQFSFDLNNNTLFKKDNQNFINLLGINQLNTLENVSLLDIYLSKNNVVEPHYHQNAAELVYCISGAATVSILNPYTKKIKNYPIKPGQVANVPQGWWHYEEATVNDTHLLAIFDAPTPEVILGSDIIKLTPANIMAKTYCMDEKEWKKAISPITPGTYIGPPKNCTKRTKTTSNQYADQYMNYYNTPRYNIPTYYWYPYQHALPYYY